MCSHSSFSHFTLKIWDILTSLLLFQIARGCYLTCQSSQSTNASEIFLSASRLIIWNPTPRRYSAARHFPSFSSHSVRASLVANIGYLCFSNLRLWSRDRRCIHFSDLYIPGPFTSQPVICWRGRSEKFCRAICVHSTSDWVLRPPHCGLIK